MKQRIAEWFFEVVWPSLSIILICTSLLLTNASHQELKARVDKLEAVTPVTSR